VIIDLIPAADHSAPFLPATCVGCERSPARFLHFFGAHWCKWCWPDHSVPWTDADRHQGSRSQAHANGGAE
jgi:hypothetical protein